MQKLPATAFSFIYHFVQRQRIRFSILILSFIVWAVSDAVFPYFLKLIINTVAEWQGAPEGVYQAVRWPLIMLALFWVGAELSMRLQGVLQIYTFPEFRANIREAVFDYVKSHSHAWFANQFAGNLAKKLADLPKSCQTIMEIICLQFATAATGAVIILVMLWFTRPIFSLLLLIWMVIHLGLTFLLMRAANSRWEIHADAVAVLSGNIVDIFSNMLNVRLFARGDHESH